MSISTASRIFSGVDFLCSKDKACKYVLGGLGLGVKQIVRGIKDTSGWLHVKDISMIVLLFYTRVRETLVMLYKLDGVGPVDNRPSTD